MIPSLPSTAKGVAVVFRSSGLLHVVRITGYDASRNARPASAGLKIFMPKPPKVNLTIAMAKNEPKLTTHQGVAGGSVIASSKPVITALPSRMVIVFFCKLVIIDSVKIAVITDEESTINAGILNKYKEKATAGNKAKTTLHIILGVVIFSLICGETES